MELEQNKNLFNSLTISKSHENTLSCSHSNAQTYKREDKQKKERQEKLNPFTLIRNYRTLNDPIHKSHKVSKKGKDKNKRKMSEDRQSNLTFMIKNQRKMTENIEIDRILEEQQHDISHRDIVSQIPNDIQFSNQESLDEKSIWEDPELEKMIPMDIRQDFLELESPLNLSSFHIFAKKIDENE